MRKWIFPYFAVGLSALALATGITDDPAVGLRVFVAAYALSISTVALAVAAVTR